MKKAFVLFPLILSFAASAALAESEQVLLSCGPTAQSGSTRSYALLASDLRTQGGSGVYVLQISDAANPGAVFPPVYLDSATYEVTTGNDGKPNGLRPRDGGYVGIIPTPEGTSITVALPPRNFLAHLVNTGGTVAGYACAAP